MRPVPQVGSMPKPAPKALKALYVSPITGQRMHASGLSCKQGRTLVAVFEVFEVCSGCAYVTVSDHDGTFSVPSQKGSGTSAGSEVSFVARYRKSWPQAALSSAHADHFVLQVHKTDQVSLPTCIHSFVECGRMQVPHSPASA